MHRALGAIMLTASCALTVRAVAGSPFLYTDPTDELSLARAAASEGDAGLLAQLNGSSRYETAIAIRASAHARAPESLIPALARHACGRDPTLAPEAAATLRKLGPLLVTSALAAREALASDLDQAAKSLHCEHAPRADIQAALEALAAALQR